jgi:hypothetical protein
MLQAVAAIAQNPVRISTDTLLCGERQPNYYYSQWYDTTDWYLYGSALDSFQVVYNDTYWLDFHPELFGWASYGGACGYTTTFQQYTPRPLRIKGLWAMVSQYKGGKPNDPGYLSWIPVIDSSRMPEYMYLYTRKDTTQHLHEYDTAELLLERIATVRWDTAHPKMMCLQKTLDPAFADQRSYCHVYEAMLDTVHVLEGEFWIGGSKNSCVGYHPTSTGTFDCFPTTYVGFMGTHVMGRYYIRPYMHSVLSLGPDGPHGGSYETVYCFGPFGVITDDQRYVEVVSDNTERGMGLYTAYYPDSSYQTITAVPNRGSRFSHWNDSVTDNPRTIFVTSDTLFTAYFAALPQYGLTATSNDMALGSVTGGNMYYEGETALLEAVASEGCRFVCWNDSVTDNPRRVVVTQDTVFTAYFERIPQYEVDVWSNDLELGYVTGGNLYYEGDEAVIEAVAHPGNHFERWNDSVRENPRRIVVVQDTAFTAVFGVGPVGVREVAAAGVKFGLVPNPAADEVRCVTEGEGFDGGVLTVVDAAGREVLRRELPRQTQAYTFRVADYPSGTYFVTLTTAKGTSTQKLVVEGK